MNLTPPLTPAVCSNCGVEERRLLHHVRHRGLFRRLCTSCVLRLHPQSFCPTCFLVYDRSPPPPSSADTVTCTKCSSASHSRCVVLGAAKSSGPYVCPPCVNPSAPIFEANCKEIDKKAAKVLLAAARVAAASTSKAAAGARAEAERRAKEAALARKRAREALEHVAFLVAREKLKRKEMLSAEVSGSGNPVANKLQSPKAAPVVEQNRIGNQHAVDGPNEVSVRLNAVGLREKEKLQGFGGLTAVSGTQNNGAVMGVEDNGRLRDSPASNENKRSDNLGQLENSNAPGEKVNNGLYSVPTVGDQLQRMQNNHGRKENMSSQH